MAILESLGSILEGVEKVSEIANGVASVCNLCNNIVDHIESKSNNTEESIIVRESLPISEYNTPSRFDQIGYMQNSHNPYALKEVPYFSYDDKYLPSTQVANQNSVDKLADAIALMVGAIILNNLNNMDEK